MTNDENTEWFKDGQNIAKAKELFSQAGYDGKPVVVLQATDHYLANPAGCSPRNGCAGRHNCRSRRDGLGRAVTRRAVKKPPAEGGWNIVLHHRDRHQPSADPDLVHRAARRMARRRGSAGQPTSLQEQLRNKFATAPTAEARQQIAKGTAEEWLGLRAARDPRPVLRNSAWRKNLTGVIGNARGGRLLEHGEGAGHLMLAYIIRRLASTVLVMASSGCSCSCCCIFRPAILLPSSRATNAPTSRTGHPAQLGLDDPCRSSSSAGSPPCCRATSASRSSPTSRSPS
jgi:hypothetical protein